MTGSYRYTDSHVWRNADTCGNIHAIRGFLNQSVPYRTRSTVVLGLRDPDSIYLDYSVLPGVSEITESPSLKNTSRVIGLKPLQRPKAEKKVGGESTPATAAGDSLVNTRQGDDGEALGGCFGVSFGVFGTGYSPPV